MNTRVYIISDLHLGSKFCRYDRFRKLLAKIPDGAQLILNGDVIDDPTASLPPEQQEVLEQLRQCSERMSIIWVEGNHDDGYTLPEPSNIEFHRNYSVDKRLYICHGHYFDNVMPYHSWFILLFRRLHNLRIKLGAAPVHIAQYAKKWPACYRYLRKNVMMNAVEYCRENGFKTVTCGHVHYAEDTTYDGIRYINTGAWTELPTYCLVANDNQITLNRNFELE